MSQTIMLPKVGIIYLSYNGKQYLDEVLEALRALNYPKDRLEIIFVDNASVDGSVEYLREVEDITFFPNSKNTGFAEGNNLGINHALLHDCDYVYLHNNDLKLDPDAIKEAVELAESDSSIGSVQSLMKYWKYPEKINSSGGMVHFLGFGFVRDNGRDESEINVTDGEEIAYASGAAVLYRSSVLKKIGLLDSYLFLYHEDLQLGWRIRLAGYKNVLSTKSIAFHDYEFKKSVKKFYWMERNRWLVHLGYLKPLTLFLLVPLMLVLEIPLILFAIKGGWIKEKLRVYVALLNPMTWAYLRRTRKEVNVIRKVSDRKIVSIFTGRISHQETSSPLVENIGNPILAVTWSLLKILIR